MRKLLSAYFSRLSKWTVFRLLIVAMFVICTGVGLLNRDQELVWNFPYMLAYMIFPHYIGIVTGLFNYPLFTNGTIRNQIAVGHGRSQIYFADWAASNTFAVILYLVSAGAMFGSAALFGSTDGVSGKAVVVGVLFSLLHIMLFTTITQLFCVMLKGVKSFLAIYLGNQGLLLLGLGVASLSTFGLMTDKFNFLFPTSTAMALNSFGIQMPGMALNGAEITEPVTQLMDYSQMVLPFTAVIVEIALVYFIGLLYFRKTDIN